MSENKAFPLTPLFNNLIITLELEPEDALNLGDSGLNQTQTVVAAGPTAQVKTGDKVLLDFTKMTKIVDGTTLLDIGEPVTVDSVNYAFIQDRIVKAIDHR